MHGTYIRWYLRNRCARKEQYLYFDLSKAFDYTERTNFLYACATCYELPSNISTMGECNSAPLVQFAPDTKIIRIPDAIRLPDNPERASLI